MKWEQYYSYLNRRYGLGLESQYATGDPTDGKLWMKLKLLKPTFNIEFIAATPPFPGMFRNSFEPIMIVTSPTTMRMKSSTTTIQ